MSFEPALAWTDEFLDWGAKADLARPRELRNGSGWRTLRAGEAEGPLLGGCLETVCWHLKGSNAWLDLDGAILVLETSEEAPSPPEVDAYLTDLEQLGVFERAAGLLFGRPYGYDEAGAGVLWRVVTERTAAAGIPVLADVDLGHTDPMLTLPLGAVARLDAGRSELGLVGPATRDPRM